MTTQTIDRQTADKTMSTPELHPWWTLALASVILSVAAASVFTPDLVTGSEQEHLPITALTCWLWGAASVGYLAVLGPRNTTSGLGVAVAVLWFAVAATSIATPEFVTGTDPTRIPLAGFIAPVVGTILTGYLCLHAAVRRG